MSYSEDPSAPQAPFSGDGSIFDQPDVLLQSPTTNERVVDTQSGFLVVIKRTGDRLALSCKRRVGTPPSSSVILSPDESLKLSKILSSSLGGMVGSFDESAGSRLPVSGRRRFGFTDPVARRSGLADKIGKPLSIVVALIVLGSAVTGIYMLGRSSAPKDIAISDPLAAGKTEKFARTFVSQMLDFNPATYKSSQIQAMSSMSPDLLEKYWKETNFPLTRRQLKSLPQGTNINIQRIDQSRTAANASTLDLYVELVNATTKAASPLHIKLQLGSGDDGAIMVLQQEDLTMQTPAPTQAQTQTPPATQTH